MAWKIERWSTDLRQNTGLIRDHAQLSSRELVIVAAAVCDAALAELIMLRLINDEGVATEFVGGDADASAPLGTFGARIQAAYLLGLLDKRRTAALHILKKLRNLAAHRATGELCDRKTAPQLKALYGLWTDGGGQDPAFLKLAKGADKKPQAAKFLISMTYWMLQQAFSDLHATMRRVDSIAP